MTTITSVQAFDFIGAIERAYDRTHDDAAWLADLTRAIAPTFGPGRPHTTAFVFDLVDERPRLSEFVSVGAAPFSREDYERLHAAGERRIPTIGAYECDVFTLLSRVISASDFEGAHADAGMKVSDALGLRANATPHSGVLFTTHVPRGHRIRDRALWTRFAAHVGAAYRLRKHGLATPENAHAVLSSDGRLEHGTNEAVIAARAELAGATRDIDKARGSLRRLDADAASALWRTMVQGSWSLVDWLDHDGKRFVLAHENPIASTTPGSVHRSVLSPREQQAVACAAMGHSNKLIAYDLGLSTGTVSVLLRRAATKLGATSRVGLIRAYRDRSARP